ncbi:MAG: hypothetical protein IJT66_03825, partial [Clostridia bacterium]|nr:hypothetical protein [Clostridia bacterium]
VNPALTGKDSYEESWKVVKWFVDEAHKRGIRIILDAIVWGTVKESPLVEEHPDWYRGKLEVWGGYKWNWYNEELRAWYADQMIEIALKTGIDGYRVDLEPFETGHQYIAGIRKRLLQMGRKLCFIAECTSERDGAYDFDEQITNEDPERWNMHTMFTERLNLVDAVKNGWGHGTIYTQDKGLGGMARFYCLCLSCHDNPRPCIEGDRIRVGYQAMFAPYVPLWFIGEDWINPLEPGRAMFNNVIRWDLKDEPERAAFTADMARMVHLRRRYPELFEYFPENHRDSNICKVESDCTLQAYARYAKGLAALILPNTQKTDREIMVRVPFADFGLKPDTTRVQEALYGNAIRQEGDSLRVWTRAGDISVVLLEKES